MQIQSHSTLVICWVLVSVVDITEITSAEVSMHQVMFSFLVTWLVRCRLRRLVTWLVTWQVMWWVRPSLVMWPSHGHVPPKFWSHGSWQYEYYRTCLGLFGQEGSLSKPSPKEFGGVVGCIGGRMGEDWWWLYYQALWKHATKGTGSFGSQGGSYQVLERIIGFDGNLMEECQK